MFSLFFFLPFLCSSKCFFLSGPCLYDVVADPTEHTDIAAHNPALVAQMQARLTLLEKSYFTNNDDFSKTSICPADMGKVTPCGCWAALNYWGGYFGPWAWGPNATAATTP